MIKVNHLPTTLQTEHLLQSNFPSTGKHLLFASQEPHPVTEWLANSRPAVQDCCKRQENYSADTISGHYKDSSSWFVLSVLLNGKKLLIRNAATSHSKFSDSLQILSSSFKAPH